MSRYDDDEDEDEVDRQRRRRSHSVPAGSIDDDDDDGNDDHNDHDDEGYSSNRSSLHSETTLSGSSPSKPSSTGGGDSSKDNSGDGSGDGNGGGGGRGRSRSRSRRQKLSSSKHQQQKIRRNMKNRRGIGSGTRTNRNRLLSVGRWIVMAFVPVCLTLLQFAKMSSYINSISTATTTASQEILDAYHWSMSGENDGRTSSSTKMNTTAAHPPTRESSPSSATETATTMLSTDKVGVTVDDTKTAEATTTLGVSSTTVSTLALLVPPGFIGGYRNQYLRFCSMVWYAKQQSSSSSSVQQQQQLLLPSILWSTTYRSVQNEKFFYPIPMKILFDVDHWNTYYPRLPRLVESNDLSPAPSSSPEGTNHNTSSSSSTTVDCWEDLDTRHSRALLQSRRTQYMEEVRNLIADSSSSNTTDTNVGNSTDTDPTKKPVIFFESPMVETLLKSSGYLRPIANESIDYYIGKRKDVSTVRKTDYSSRVQHCTNPKVIGGGKGAGTLWNMWTNKIHAKLLQEQKEHEKQRRTGNKTTDLKTATSDDGDDHDESGSNTKLFTLISQALRPHPQWRNVAHQCIHHHLRRQSNVNRADDDARQPQRQQQQETSPPPYLALHARVEVDMMLHKCGKKMEKNLTKIFEMADTFLSDYNKNVSGTHNDNDNSPQLQGTFVAVSRNSMQIPTTDKEISAFADNNWAVLNIRSPQQQQQQQQDHGLLTGDERITPIFECGEIWMDKWYNDTSNSVIKGDGDHNHQTDDFYGSIVPSIINFYIAVHATIFVGVDKSSWSTDVWTTRYHLGKGETNFRYTQHDGVIPVSNGGLPPPHKNC